MLCHNSNLRPNSSEILDLVLSISNKKENNIINELVNEIKIKDNKLLEQENLIRKLKNELSLLKK